MKTIIPPIDKVLLKRELNKDTFLRDTNNGNNEIYIVSDIDSPNVVREIGRLREITFRNAGGGTGKSCDLEKCRGSGQSSAVFRKRTALIWQQQCLGGLRRQVCRQCRAAAP